MIDQATKTSYLSEVQYSLVNAIVHNTLPMSIFASPVSTYHFQCNKRYCILYHGILQHLFNVFDPARHSLISSFIHVIVHWCCWSLYMISLIMTLHISGEDGEFTSLSSHYIEMTYLVCQFTIAWADLDLVDYMKCFMSL